MSGNNCTYRAVRCPECGVIVYTNGTWARCEDCRKECDREKKHISYMRERRPDPDAYLVVYDPTPVEDGGYRPGKASFCREQTRYMLLESVAAFTVGTILRNKGGQLFRVIQEGRQYKLITVQNLCKV